MKVLIKKLKNTHKKIVFTDPKHLNRSISFLIVYYKILHILDTAKLQ